MNTITLYQKQQQTLAFIINAISTGALKSCDGLMVTEPIAPFIKHYFTYAYQDNDGNYWFFVTMASIGEVKLMNENEILNLALKHNFTLKKHIPFRGSESQRKAALNRGMKALGKPYRWVGANCENLMQYIQTGVSKSKQTIQTSTGVMAAGGLLMMSKNKAARTGGIFLILIGLIGLIIDKTSDF